MPTKIVGNESQESINGLAVTWITDSEGHVYAMPTARLAWLRARGIRNITPKLELDGEGAGPAGSVPAVTVAIGILAQAKLQGETLNDEQIAKLAGCDRTNLQHSKTYKALKAFELNARSPRRGMISDGEVDSIEEKDEESEE